MQTRKRLLSLGKCNFGPETQGSEELEVAFRANTRIGTRPIGKAAALRRFRSVNQQTDAGIILTYWAKDIATWRWGMSTTSRHPAAGGIWPLYAHNPHKRKLIHWDFRVQGERRPGSDPDNPLSGEKFLSDFLPSAT